MWRSRSVYWRQNDANTREWYDLSNVYLGTDNFIEHDNLDKTTRVKVTILLNHCHRFHARMTLRWLRLIVCELRRAWALRVCIDKTGVPDEKTSRSTYWVRKVNAADVMLAGNRRPLIISCHSFLLITSTSPPRNTTNL